MNRHEIKTRKCGPGLRPLLIVGQSRRYACNGEKPLLAELVVASDETSRYSARDRAMSPSYLNTDLCCRRRKFARAFGKAVIFIRIT
jgi:hypothetical protein